MTTREMTNGVDTQALFGALDAVQAQPEAAKFQFRVRNRWIKGTHSRSEIHDFFGLGTEQTHREPRSYDADHPQQLVAQDEASTPVEYLLHALAACITAGIGNIASVRGIELNRVESTVTGDVDIVGLLGLDDSVRNGFQKIEMSIEIDGDASPEELAKVVKRSIARSAVYDMLTNGTSVAVAVKA